MPTHTPNEVNTEPVTPEAPVEEVEAEDTEPSLEDVVSQLMIDNMALKSLLIQKEVFSADDFQAIATSIQEEILGSTEEAPQPETPAE